MSIEFLAKSVNESFARLVLMGFIAPLDPTEKDMTEIKTVVSEAVTNAIIHGYNGDESGVIKMNAILNEQTLRVVVEDNGCGITNVEQAKLPLYTTKPEEERSGLGFMIMESFSDTFEVYSTPGEGTTIIFEKQFICEDNTLTFTPLAK